MGFCHLLSIYYVPRTKHVTFFFLNFKDSQKSRKVLSSSFSMKKTRAHRNWITGLRQWLLSTIFGIQTRTVPVPSLDHPVTEGMGKRCHPSSLYNSSS